MTSNPEIAQRISRKLRQLVAAHASMSQRELAEAIEIPTMVWNMALRGKATPNTAAVIKIAEYFRITTDELLGVSTPKRTRRKRAS